MGSQFPRSHRLFHRTQAFGKGSQDCRKSNAECTGAGVIDRQPDRLHGLREGEDRLNQFLEEIALDQDRLDEKDKQGEGVTLITMHSCKGLEYPHVHIVGLEQGLLPHTRSIDEGSLDEERRLFYVAITRAMESLTISHCETRNKFGQTTPCQPSVFLNELPDKLVELADDVFKRPVSPSSGAAMFDALKSSLDLSDA